MRHSLLVLVALILLFLAAAPRVTAGLGDNSVGMNIHLGRQSFIDACADLGVGWVRMDANWFNLNPSLGVYNYGQMENYVTRANAAGLKVFVSLGYTPEWVSRKGDSDGEFGNDCPVDSTDWVNFVQNFVTHFSAAPYNVTHFGIWNEPNLDGFFEGTLDDYANIILLPGAAAVRAACPTCLVLGPELANVGDCDVYLEGVLSRVPINTFDIVTHHIYQDFIETGCLPYGLGGDCFENALEFQRFPFTRRSLKQILDAAGWAGEVWITETGDRATPGDSGEENNQATFVTRVLEEQLSRAWYTNSFFYEIQDCKPDQPECTIDGFGLMRAVTGSPGSRTFPGDFRLKPAFLALRQFIDDHPEIVGTQPPPQCGDGADNDGDGRTDLDDRGCTGALDDDESDDPPRLRLSAYRTPGMTLDGDCGEVGPDGWLLLGEEAWHGIEPLTGAGDLSVRVAVRWAGTDLYLAFEVTDDVHDNDHVAAELWQADSIQLAFDVGADGGDGYDDSDDHEFGFALAAGQVVSYRFHGPAGATDDFSTAIVRQGTTTNYEIRIGSAALPGVSFTPGTLARFSFLVNDADGAGRLGWIEWTSGIGVSKIPEWYGEIELLDQTSPADIPDGGADAGNDAGADSGADAGTDSGSDSGADQIGDLEQDAGADSGSDSGNAGDQAGASEGCGCMVRSPGRAGAIIILATILLLGMTLRQRPTRGDQKENRR
ncbi:MAG TPA: sugar-binding protein [Myxococcota bacterium]|nr:sugar-binding protein [Myxococcota bacterium]